MARGGRGDFPRHVRAIGKSSCYGQKVKMTDSRLSCKQKGGPGDRPDWIGSRQGTVVWEEDTGLWTGGKGCLVVPGQVGRILTPRFMTPSSATC